MAQDEKQLNVSVDGLCLLVGRLTVKTALLEEQLASANKSVEMLTSEVFKLNSQLEASKPETCLAHVAPVARERKLTGIRSNGA